VLATCSSASLSRNSNRDFTRSRTHFHPQRIAERSLWWKGAIHRQLHPTGFHFLTTNSHNSPLCVKFWCRTLYFNSYQSRGNNCDVVRQGSPWIWRTLRLAWILADRNNRGCIDRSPDAVVPDWSILCIPVHPLYMILSAASGSVTLQKGHWAKSQNPQRLQNLASVRFSESQLEQRWLFMDYVRLLYQIFYGLSHMVFVIEDRS